MSKGKWKVFSQMIGSEKQYIIGRQLDESKPLHGGNVEYYDGYSENRVAQQMRADHLNEMEAYEAARPVDRRVDHVEFGKQGQVQENIRQVWVPAAAADIN